MDKEMVKEIIEHSKVTINKDLIKIYKAGLDAENKRQYSQALRCYQCCVDIVQSGDQHSEHKFSIYHDALNRAKEFLIVEDFEDEILSRSKELESKRIGSAGWILEQKKLKEQMSPTSTIVGYGPWK